MVTYFAKSCLKSKLKKIGFLSSENAGVRRLTNAGHEYIEAIRSDTVWTKTKEATAAVGGMTLGMMRDVAIAYLKQEVSEKLGVKL